MRRTLLTLLLSLAMSVTLLAPGIASADGGSSGPYYMGLSTRDAYVRDGQVMQEEDFAEDDRPRPGDQLFFNEALYHSTRRGAKGTRAGGLIVHCVVGMRMQFLCDARMRIRGEGTVYFSAWAIAAERFAAAVTGGTGVFRHSRGDVVISELPRHRSLYQLRLR